MIRHEERPSLRRVSAIQCSSAQASKTYLGRSDTAKVYDHTLCQGLGSDHELPVLLEQLDEIDQGELCVLF